MVWRYNNKYVKGTKKKNLKKGPKWYGPYVVQSITLTGNYYLQHRTKLTENARAYAPHHLKAYIPRNPRIPQYSDDEYEHEDKVILESDKLPDLPPVPEEVPGMSEDESVSSFSQMSICTVETIESKGFNTGDRKLLDVFVSIADCFLQESAMSGDVSRCFNITIVEEECTGPMTPIFFPLSLYYRKQIASKFNLGDALGKLSIEGIVGSTCMKNYVSKHVVGDGNCFFRAIAFLIKGSELSHNIICVNLVAYIVEEANWDHLKQYVPTKYSTGLEYVNNTRMAFFGEWATKVELFTCAQFTG